jgi:pSer/pThr/pTyr-binding forkhead associated (FHA) protein
VLDGYILQIVHGKQTPSSKNVSKARAYLEANSGQTFPLDSNEVLVGRKDPKHNIFVDIDLTPLDSRRIVTRKHAIFEKKNNQWTLTDLGSVNGTWLNGHKLEVRQSYPLQDADEMVFGRNGVVLKFLNQK